MISLLFFSILPFINAKKLWSTTPVTNYSNIIKETYLLGNGRLGAMPFGSPGSEKIVINIDSLWSGGPYSADNYTGGNPTEPKYQYLEGIRDWIFENTTGNVTALYGNGDDYGTYQVMGNLSLSYNVSVKASSYTRLLDLNTGIYGTKFEDAIGETYTTTVFCSYPDQVCVYNLNSSTALPQITIKLENQFLIVTTAQSLCGAGFARLRGVTQVGPPEGMRYESVAMVIGADNATSCNNRTGVLMVPKLAGRRSISIVLAAGTNYDRTKGNAANSFSFRGEDPREHVQQIVTKAASKSISELHERHLEDYQLLSGAFTLELPDPYGSLEVETALLFERYNSSSGDPFVESLLFDYSRHLLTSSSRENSLPANLQGRWSSELGAAWSADYHANINIQMNYWGAEQTGLGSGVQEGLWRFMVDTWVPRGAETARLLYGAPGWVTHSEMNIFGHTAMKNDAQWANYPASTAWMMQHVSDHFSYSQDVAWLKETGYPLLKGVTQFWLPQLQEDTYWNDGTLVVNPCNSPEHGPTTFACTHYQQLLHQLFASNLHLAPFAAEPDTDFLQNVTDSLNRLDKGFHTTSWGGVAEWKLPQEGEEVYDNENNTHRHLSHLWGWFPGLTLSSPSPPYSGGFANATIQNAVATSLYSRGNGNGVDANAGWAKVWRAACWARLNNTKMAYGELKYAIEQNFVGNGLSMYSGTEQPFQIDANFGLAGAVLSMLVVDIDEPVMGKERTVVLGPAIPEAWGDGSVKGLRLRGGGSVDFVWGEDAIVRSMAKGVEGVRFVDREGMVIDSHPKGAVSNARRDAT